MPSTPSVLSIVLLAQVVLTIPAPQAALPQTTSIQATTTSADGSGSSYATIPAGCPTPALQCYQCDSQFPSSDTWTSWECMAAQNRAVMVAGNDGTVDGPNEADDVLNAIQVTAQAANIDPRIVLAQVMQESIGFVRAGYGDGGSSSGLMQVQLLSGQAASCYDTSVNECPYTTILEMVQDGVFGHAGSTNAQAPGIGYWLPAEGGDVGKALRAYNTGKIIDPNDLANIVATNPTNGKKYFAGTQAYVTDVANRLTGARVGLPHTPTCPLVTDPNTYVAASCGATQ